MPGCSPLWVSGLTATHGGSLLSACVRLRPLSWVVAIVCAAFLLGALHRLALQAYAAGLLREAWGSLLLADLQVIKSLLTLALGLAGVVVVRHAAGVVRRLERQVTVLADGAVPEAMLEAGFTPRELEVLDVLSDGRITDMQIADALCIAPSTAKTHIRTSWPRPAQAAGEH